MALHKDDTNHKNQTEEEIIPDITIEDAATDPLDDRNAAEETEETLSQDKEAGDEEDRRKDGDLLSDLLEEGEYQENFNEDVTGVGSEEGTNQEDSDFEDDDDTEEEGEEDRIRKEIKKRPPVKKPKRQASPAREWLSDHLRYILLILAICAVVVIIFFLAKGISGAAARKSSAGSSSASEKVTGTSTAESAAAEAEGDLEIVSGSEAVESVSETGAAVSESAPASESGADSDAANGNLTEADADVTEVITAYYNSLQQAETNELIESYSNIKCYSYPGKNEGTFVVFATADYKYKDYSETIPSLSEFYLAPGSDGKPALVENISDADEEYMSEIEARPEVQKLIAQVSEKYDQVVNANPDLKAYIEGLN